MVEKMHMKRLADRMRTTLLDAFSAVPYPGDGDLVNDPDDDDPEVTTVANAFRGKRWQDVSAEMVRRHGDSLPLFSPAAFRFFLPAYMMGCAMAYYDVDVARDGVIFNLTPPTDRTGWQWEWFWARAQQFGDQEREAIKCFLELMRQYEQDDSADESAAPSAARVLPAIDFWSDLGKR